MILEADSTNSEEGLLNPLLELEGENSNRHSGGGDPDEAMGGWSQSTGADLTTEDATLAFGLMDILATQQLKAAGVGNVRMLKVFLGDSMERGVTGSGREYYKRDRALNRGEIDIFVDSRVPVLQEVLKWAEKVTGACRVIYFETGDKAYFTELKRVLGLFGFTLLGNPPGYKQMATVRALIASKPELTPEEPISDEEWDSVVPRLIYYNTTAQSVNAAYTSRIENESDPTRCCVVVDKYSGLVALEHLKAESGNQLSVICPALIYDDLLRQVRVWTRLGYNAETIQAELDTQTCDILDMSHKTRVKIKPQAIAADTEGLSEAWDEMHEFGSTREEETLKPETTAEEAPADGQEKKVERNSGDIPREPKDS